MKSFAIIMGAENNNLETVSNTKKFQNMCWIKLARDPFVSP
jgi:hypothetical protein